MKVSRRQFAALLASAAAVSGSARAASPDTWRTDLDAIAGHIERIHPNPWFTGSREAFFREKRAIERGLERMSEEERVARAMALVALIGDGHTQVSPLNDAFRSWYGVRLYEFTDGYFVTSAYGADADLAGAQVLEIAGRPVADVVNAARALMGGDNAFDRMERLFAVHNAPLMRALGFADGNGALAISARMASGQIVSRRLAAQTASDPVFADGGPPFEWQARNEVFGPPLGALGDWRTAFRDLPALAFRTPDPARPAHLIFRRLRIAQRLSDDVHYMQLNYTGDAGDETMEAFTRRTLGELDARPARALIVDIRYNIGGDGSKVAPFIHQFIRRAHAPPWRDLYVLTGRRTFSAGVMMAAAFVDHTRANFVGEPAGGALDHYGDATAIDLSATGLRLTVSTLFHQLQDQGQRYDILPVDAAAPFSFDDWRNGRDPAVDAIVRGEEMRSLANIAIAESGEAARRAFSARQASPHRDWMKTRSFDLIRGTWRLADLDRRADGLVLAQIHAELYPDSARGWAVLGDNQIALDQREAALASYRRALMLDPTNLDNLSQRAALREAGQTVP